LKPSPRLRSRWVCAPLAAALLLVLLFSAHSAPEAQASTSLRGVVLDENGSPVEDAAVRVWFGKALVATGITGADGRFDLEAEAGDHYVVYVLADDNATPGVDYLPLRAEVATSDRGELRFILVAAASLVLEGDIQFVESENLPLSIAYTVMNPTSEEVMDTGGVPLEYGSAPGSLSVFLGLPPSHLVVPAGVPFSVGVNCSLVVGSSRVYHRFKVDEPGHLLLERGERTALDVRRYSLPFNLGIVEALQSRVGSRMSGMESVGFYIAAERTTAVSAVRQLSDARYLYEEGRYVESFDAAKRSYLKLTQTLRDLGDLYGDAALSVHMLIFFFALASVAIAFMLADGGSTKLLGSAAVYAVTLAVLYLTYPGSIIIPAGRFLGSAVLSIASSLAAAALLPRLLRGRGRGGHVPVRNIVVPIFSIAKRSNRRRRLRFALTLVSISVLVMSFVALTSFSEGYGLVVSRIQGRRAPATGVLLRAPGYIAAEPVFMTEEDLASGWLDRQPESRAVSPKAENFPITQPVATLNGVPISGIVGIDPSVESAMMNLDAVVREGELPSEGGILISEVLRGDLGVNVGDSLTLSALGRPRMTVTLQGVFDDGAFSRLRDLDGSPYLPNKMVDATPAGGSPTFVLTSCDPSEIVVTHLSTALGMPLVGVTRVDIAVGDGVEVNAFAERLALERGYDAWFSSGDGVYFARLGSYLEGRGLPLLVPWAVVVLNVVVTMLNSMYERRREIRIFSSVGLNPAQIAAIFFAEASIIGVIAGGAGYLSGLALYKVMALLKLALEVHQKISAFWSLAAIGVAMTAVLMGTLAALRRSVILTPSLRRHWRIEDKRRSPSDPWEIPIPVKLPQEDVEGFVDFVVHALRALEDRPVRRTASIRVSGGAGEARQIGFVYKAAKSMEGGNFHTGNTIIVEERPEGTASVTLRSYGDENCVRVTGTLVRMIVMRWSTRRGSPGASSRL